jgi:uncharacterized membrane protein YeaQ/YmgE (transglycosylase-associated protein family)
MTNLTFPVLVFGSIVGLLIGALFHLVAGGKLIRLIFCLIFGWIGFWVGNYFSQRFEIQIYQYGLISYGTSIIASLIFAAGGYWISGENKPDPGL